MLCPALLVAFTIAASAAPAAADPVVLTIDAYSLSQAAFAAMWEALPSAQRAAYEAQGGPKAYLDTVIEQKLLALAAERHGIDRRPQIAATLEAAHDSIIGRVYLDEEIRDKIVTPEAMREYYEAHKTGFVVPEMVQARHLLATPFVEKKTHNSKNDDAKSEAEAKAKIERLHQAISDGGDFAELARLWSEDLTAPAGGKLEAFGRGRMSKPIEDAAFALQDGTVSEVIRTPVGFHLIKVEKRIPERQQTYDELVDRLRAAVAQERRESFAPRFKQTVELLRAASKIEIREAGLPPFTPPAATGAGAPTK